MGFKNIYQRAENGWSLKKHISKGTLQQLKAAKPQIILASLGGNNQDMKTSSYKNTVDQLISVAKSIERKLYGLDQQPQTPPKLLIQKKRHKWTHKFLLTFHRILSTHRQSKVYI